MSHVGQFTQILSLGFPICELKIAMTVRHGVTVSSLARGNQSARCDCCSLFLLALPFVFRGFLHVGTAPSLTSFLSQASVTSLSVHVSCECWGEYYPRKGWQWDLCCGNLCHRRSNESSSLFSKCNPSSIHYPCWPRGSAWLWKQRQG